MADTLHFTLSQKLRLVNIPEIIITSPVITPAEVARERKAKRVRSGPKLEKQLKRSRQLLDDDVWASTLVIRKMTTHRCCKLDPTKIGRPRVYNRIKAHKKRLFEINRAIHPIWFERTQMEKLTHLLPTKGYENLPKIRPTLAQVLYLTYEPPNPNDLSDPILLHKLEVKQQVRDIFAKKIHKIQEDALRPLVTEALSIWDEIIKDILYLESSPYSEP